MKLKETIENNKVIDMFVKHKSSKLSSLIIYNINLYREWQHSHSKYMLNTQLLFVSNRFMDDVLYLWKILTFDFIYVWN